MAKWSVALPISGVAYVEVEADDEKGAIEAALEAEVTYEDIAEWETLRRIVQGNACYAMQWEAEADLISED